MGDFNDILSNEDKRSMAVCASWLVRGFQEAIQESNLHGLPMEGYQYTWTKFLGTLESKEERLYRALVTQSW